MSRKVDDGSTLALRDLCLCLIKRGEEVLLVASEEFDGGNVLEVVGKLQSIHPRGKALRYHACFNITGRRLTKICLSQVHLRW